MSEIEQWQTRNDAYLSASLAVIRTRLSQAARPVAVATPTLNVTVNPASTSPTQAEETGWSLFRRKGARPSESSPVPRLPAPSDADLQAMSLERAMNDLAAASEGDPPPALLMLSKRLGLSDFERDLLMMCIAMELDTRTASLCAQAQDDTARHFPTFALGMAVLDAPAWEALSPERPLRYWRLVEISQPGAQPLTASALRADERIVSFVKGLNYLDDRLAPLVAPMGDVSLESLPASQRLAAQRIVADLSSAPVAGRPIALVGRDGESKRRVAAAAAAAMGLHLYRLPLEMLPGHVGELETLARLWQRENRLLPLALYVDADELDNTGGMVGTDSPLQRLTRFVTRTTGLIFIATRDVISSLLDARLSVEVNKPTAAEQACAWAAALGEEAADLPGVLSGQFNLNQQDIDTIVASANASPGAEPLEGSRVGTVPRAHSTAARWPCRAHRREGDLAADRVAEGGSGAAGADCSAGGCAQQGLRRMGLAFMHESRPRHQCAVCGRKRHGEDDGRRGAGERLVA